MAPLTVWYLEGWANDYADIRYQLSGTSVVDINLDHSLQIELLMQNKGNINGVPLSEIGVVNATITQVSINKVAQTQLPRFCTFNETVATIANLTIDSGSALSTWATVYIIPKEGVSSFMVYAKVKLTGVSHPKDEVLQILPIDLIYNRTSINVYSLES